MGKSTYTVSEFDTILANLNGVFDTPEYLAEWSRGRLKGPRSQLVLEESRRELDALAAQHPQDPKIPFLAGVVARYLGDSNGFTDGVNRALAADPSFLEGIIARREGSNYLDPFCYPAVQDVLADPMVLRPVTRLGLRVPGGRIDSVRVGVRILPIVVIKSPLSKFRCPPDEAMDMALGVDLCAVSSPTHGGRPVALMALWPVLADDPYDPFFKIIFINLFPVGDLAQAPDYQPFLGRYEALRLCEPPYQTIFVFLDESGDVLMAREVDLNPVATILMRAREILLRLPDESVTVSEWRKSVAVYDAHGWIEVPRQSAGVYRVPKYRSAANRKGVLHEIKSNKELSGLRGWGEPPVTDPVPYDLFISHKHDDQRMADSLSKWIRTLWPDAQLFMTSRDQIPDGAMTTDHYLDQVPRSECMLILATSLALASRYVQKEIQLASKYACEVVLVSPAGTDPKFTAIDKPLALGVRAIVDLGVESAESSLIAALSQFARLGEPKHRYEGLLERLGLGRKQDWGGPNQTETPTVHPKNHLRLIVTRNTDS